MLCTVSNCSIVDMKGTIYGGKYSKEWTKYSKGHKITFQNPLHQNYGHVKTVQQMTGLPESTIVGVVVLAGSAKMKSPIPEKVISIDQLSGFVRKYKTEIFADEECSRIVKLIEQVGSHAMQDKAEHVQSLYEREIAREADAAAMICPRCGKRLVFRNGKRGVFIGCSGYPGCRFTRNI